MTFAKESAFNFIEAKTRIEIEKIFEKVRKGIDIKAFLDGELPSLSELNKERISFENFKKYLNKATERMQSDGKKLVVIIDELDRCKPTFAIQTLEIIKHIFDIKNIVFIFAVDIEQLSHGISSIYGQGFDSVGYLCRFFDYISKLPNPNMEKFISYKFDEVNIPKETTRFIQLQEFILKLVKIFNLSMRDVDTIIQSYKILYDTKLNEYTMIEAHFVYLFYLTLKYKMPNIYHEVFIDKSKTPGNISQIISEFQRKIQNRYILASFENLLYDDIFQKRKMVLYSGEIEKTREIFISEINGNKIMLEGAYWTTAMDQNTNWGRVLFEPDIKRWYEIKQYTYREYIHKQLENYNFVNMDFNMEE